mgnify:CR=1 FL=1
MRILVVEDERSLARAIVKILEKGYYSADSVGNGADALEYLDCGNYDAVILDVMMPVMDGITALKKIRERGNCIPVLVLTAKSEVDDKVRGLDSGADYYLTKPFGVMELVSCVKAVLRRCRPAKETRVLRRGGLCVDLDAHTATVDGERVPLTYKEFELLRLFLSNPGIAFTRDQLMDKVWGTDYSGETRTVDTHILTLRQKLGPCGAMIETVRNVGYRLEGETT